MLGTSSVARVVGDGLPQGAGGGFEDRLGDVVVVRAVGDGDVQVHLGVGRERL